MDEFDFQIIPANKLQRILANIMAMNVVQEIGDITQVLHRLRTASALGETGHDARVLNEALRSIIDAFEKIVESVVFDDEEVHDPQAVMGLGLSKQAIQAWRKKLHVDNFDPEKVKAPKKKEKSSEPHDA